MHATSCTAFAILTPLHIHTLCVNPNSNKPQLKLGGVNIHAISRMTLATLAPMHMHPLYVNQNSIKPTKDGMTEYACFFLHGNRNSGTVAHTSFVNRHNFERTSCDCFEYRTSFTLLHTCTMMNDKTAKQTHRLGKM